MRIVRDNENGILTFVPMTLVEMIKVAQVAKTLKPSGKLVYGGVERFDRQGEIKRIRLHIGSKEEEVTTHYKEGGSLTRSVHIGGITLGLMGSTEKDRQEVDTIRDLCFFGTGDLVLKGVVRVGWKTSLVVTGSYCKLCHNPMVTPIECEWKVCDKCTATCDHNYIKGAVHGGGIDIGLGYFCDKCGRGKALTEIEKHMSVLDHHLAVEKELGVNIFYKNGPFATPSELAAAQNK